MSPLSSLLTTAAVLAGSGSSATAEAASNLRTILISRLEKAREDPPNEAQAENLQSLSLEDAQLETALQALIIICSVQDILDKDTSASIGTRDVSHLRTLLSIIFRWMVDPLLARISTRSSQAAKDYTLLSSAISRVIALIFPSGVQGAIPQTLITSTLVNRHVADILRPALVLGWLPVSLSSEEFATCDAVRPPIMRLLSIIPPAESITALGSVLSSQPPPPVYVRKSATSLLSRQLLRPGGVRGVFAAVFGESEEESEAIVELEKFEHVSKVLSAVPKGVSPEEYFIAIIPRVVTILAPSSSQHMRTPPSHRRAAAFVLARMLDTELSDNSFTHSTVARRISLSILHAPFLPTSISPNDHSTSASSTSLTLTPATALYTLETLLTNAPPSSGLTPTLFSPILPVIYALLETLEHTRTADPALREIVRSLVRAWAKVVGKDEGEAIIWAIIERSVDDYWEWNVEIEDVKIVEKTTRVPTLSILTPADHDTGFDLDSNPLDLKPDPVHFSRWLASLDRADVLSMIFVRLLNGYREMKTARDADPMRVLLYLQLILQMQSQVSESQKGIMNTPEHVLTFVQHALEPVILPLVNEKNDDDRTSTGLRLDDLRIVPEDAAQDGDSDDEADTDEVNGGGFDEEMTVTAINLLLSVLEANPDLSAMSMPILDNIFSLLEPLTNHPVDAIRPLARDARMILTARLASTSAGSPRSTEAKNADSGESPSDIYQKALKLLQDPLLPVRAHGLLLLRQLVSPPSRATKIDGISSSSSAPQTPLVDPALVPAILAIFLQSAQDDDSYMFLNAVQGLAAMVDGFGRDVLKGLVEVYVGGLSGTGGGAMTKQDVHVKVRVGEALGQVIRRCGDALGIYVDLLVPPLFQVVRMSHLATTLRTSAISLLAQCADTNILAILPYVADLSDAMVDLLQVESVTAVPSAAPISKHSKRHDGEQSTGTEPEVELAEPQPSMDSHPTSSNSKFPPLRRAALHFLALLVRSCTARVYDSGPEDIAFPGALVRRAQTVLGYIAVTDVDAVVRVMARECVEELDGLGRAMMGI